MFQNLNSVLGLRSLLRSRFFGVSCTHEQADLVFDSRTHFSVLFVKDITVSTSIVVRRRELLPLVFVLFASYSNHQGQLRK